MRAVSADFVMGVTDVGAIPEESSFEVAVIGRSNAGKSTLLNRIFERKKLAKVSATPGKTREINIYKVRLRDETKKDHECRFFDLPGYGYAKLSAKERESFARLIVSFIQERNNLKVALLLMDIRREVEEEERSIWDLIAPFGYVVLTKSDKLSKSDQAKAKSEICANLNVSPEKVLISGEKIPTSPIFQAILTAF